MSIIALYTLASAINIYLINYYKNYHSYLSQYCIFLFSYLGCAMFADDKKFSLHFGRLNDKGFRVAVRTLSWVLTAISFLGIFFMEREAQGGSIKDVSQYSIILLLNIIFYQEIKRLLFSRS